jgi:uncharacterized membrane protein YfcA
MVGFPKVLSSTPHVIHITQADWSRLRLHVREGIPAMAGLHPWLMYPLLALLGGVIGTYGTLIGAGGGIFLVPTLRLLYP